MPRINSDVILGLFMSLVGLAAIFVWIPLDTGSGIVDRVRGSYIIGDALAPTIAFSLLAFAGVLLTLEANAKEDAPRFTLENLGYLCVLLVILAVAIGLFRWTGPVAASLYGLVSDESTSYRNLRDMVPWKYLGYLSGGTVLVGGLICLIKRQISFGALAIGFIASLAMAAFYDLPFDTLLLPPNGDV